MSSTYTIFTVANKRPFQSYYTFDEFFKSLHGEPINILGSHPNEYQGLGSKPRLLYNAIKNGHAPTSHIIFCDCFDLVFAIPLKDLFKKYKNFNRPVVISAEKNCFPSTYKKEFDERHKGESPYKYLNSGMIVGETEAILTILESMDAPNIPPDHWDGTQMVEPNDQEYYQHEYVKQPVEIVLDVNQELCNCLHSVELDELDFSEDRIANKTTMSYPASFHLNGGAKTGPCREPILKHLNLI